MPQRAAQLENHLLTIQESADLLHVAAKTLRRWEEKGVLVPQRSEGGHRRYTRPQIMEFKKQLKRGKHLKKNSTQFIAPVQAEIQPISPVQIVQPVPEVSQLDTTAAELVITASQNQDQAKQEIVAAQPVTVEAPTAIETMPPVAKIEPAPQPVELTFSQAQTVHQFQYAPVDVVPASQPKTLPPAPINMPQLYQGLHPDQKRVLKRGASFLGIVIALVILLKLSPTMGQNVATAAQRMPGYSSLAQNMTPVTQKIAMLWPFKNLKQPATVAQASTLRSTVLGDTRIINENLAFKVNIPSRFGEVSTFDKNITVAGAIAADGGSITTTATTFNLVNTTATTVNIAGAASQIKIGSTAGITEISNALNVADITKIKGVPYSFPIAQGASTTYLKNDGTGKLIWESLNIPTQLSDLSQLTGTLGVGHGGTGSTSFGSGSVIFSDGSKLTENNANFYWDEGNKRLGILTNSPVAAFSVGSSSQFQVDTGGAITAVTGYTQSSGNFLVSGATSKITVSSLAANGGVIYTNTSGDFLNTGAGGVNQCLASDGFGGVSWVGCAAGSSNDQWFYLNGMLSPINSTADVGIGGTATTSAKFAFINVAAGTPTASISGSTAGRALSLNGDGTIATALNQSLALNPNGGNVGVGTSNPAGLFSVGSSSQFQVNSSGAIAAASGITSSGTIRFTGLVDGIIKASGGIISGGHTIDLTTDVTGVLPIANGGTNGTAVPTAGAIAYGTGTEYAFMSPNATAGLCLTSGGAGAPSWGACDQATSVSPFQNLNGAIVPFNSTQDFLVGGQSTASAKFAFLNVNSGTPTASIAGSVTGRALSLTGDGSISTTLNRSLAINPAGGFVGIGNSNPTSLFSVGSSSQFQVNSSGAIAAATGITSSGTITFSGLGNGFVKSTAGVLSNSATVDAATEISGLLPIANGGTNSNAVPVAGGLAYGDGSTYQFSAAGTAGQCLISGGLFAPVWGPCTGANSITPFGEANGTIFALNSTEDLLVGGQSSASAKFAFLNVASGTPTASIAGSTAGWALSLDGDGSISTALNRSLALNPNGGNVGVGTSNPAGLFSVGSTSQFQVNSAGAIAAATGINSSGTITFSGLADGIIKATGGVLSGGNSVSLTTDVSGILPIANGGTNGTAAPTAGTVAYGNGTAYAFTTVGVSGQCLVSAGSSAPVWGGCDAASSITPFQQLAGAIVPNNTTVDFLIGGQSTASAKFAFLNVNSGTPTASIAGSTNALVLTASGQIQTTANQSLALGGSTTGNITFNPLNGTGITTNNGTFVNNGGVTVNGLINATGNITGDVINGVTGINTGSGAGTQRIDAAGNLSSIGTINASGVVTFGNYTTQSGLLYTSNTGVISQTTQGASGTFLKGNGSGAPTWGNVTLTTDVSGILPIANGGTNSNAAPVGGALAYGTGSAYAFSAAGTLGDCLLSGGSGAPTWANCAMTSATQWIEQNGALYTKNSTTDLLVGGQSTASAKFAVLNVNTGTPTASVSGSTGAAYLTADGTLQTTRNQTLSLGGATTGNIYLNPLNGTGRVGINTNSPGATLGVAGTATISGNTTLGNNLNVIGSGTFGNGLVVSAAGANIAGGLTATGGQIFSGGINNSNAGISNVGAITGGTGITSSGTITFSGLSTGIVHANSSGVLSSSAVNLAGGATEIAGVLPAVSGGTGLSSYNVGDLIYATGTTTLGVRGIGATNQVLTVSGGVPTWATISGAGGICPDCLVNDPGSTQVLQATSSTATALTIKQPVGGSVDIFNITDPTGATKYFRVDSNGNVILGDGSSIGVFTVNPVGSDPISISPNNNNGTAYTGTITSNVLTQARTWTFPDETGTICLSSGNCLTGGTGVSGTGTANHLAKFQSATGLTDSILYDDGTLVGIGNNSPAYKLDVNGTLHAVGATVLGNNLAVSGAATVSGTFIADGATNLHSTLGVTSDTNLGGLLDVTGATTLHSSLNVTGNATFDTNTLFVNATTNRVGIGNASPGYTLDVTGDTHISSALNLGTNFATSGALNLANNTAIAFRNAANSGNITALTVDGSNNTILGGGLTVTSGGNISIANLAGAGKIPYITDASGTLGVSAAGSAGQCLISGGTGAPSWTACAAGASTSNVWDSANGAIIPNNSTLDLLVGGQSTASAKFAFINVNSGTPTASISTGAVSTFLTADGTLGTTARQSLILGSSSTYNTSGNVLINPAGGSVGIGVTTPKGILDINGGTGTTVYFHNTASGANATDGGYIDYASNLGMAIYNQENGPLTFGSNNVERLRISNNGNIGIGTTIPGSSLVVNGTVQFPTFTAVNGIFYATSSGQLAQLPQGAANTVLHGNGASAPSWSAIDLASADVTNTLPISRGGTNGTATPTQGAIAYGNGTAYAFSLAGSSGQCLVSGGTGSPTWTNCATGAGTIFQSTNGAINPLNSTQDFLIGGQASSSAKFAVLNVNSGTPTASLSASGASGFYFTASGSAQTTGRQTLALGGGTTGNISINNINNTPFGFFDTTNSRFGLGTTTPAAKLDVQDAGITTGNGIAGTFNGLTSGTALALSSTSTGLTTGGLASFDWSPTSATTATGDLVSLNVGSNGTIGNIFNVKNNGSSVFSVSQSKITANLPTQFTAPGDVGFAYDVQFFNPVASYIKSTGSLNLQSGEVFNSSDLTFKTYNAGAVIVDSQSLLVNQAATVAGQLVVGTSAAPANIGNFYLTNSSTFGKSLAILNQTESQDIFTASGSGTTRFTIASGGNVSIANLGTAGGIPYITNASGTLGVSLAGTSGQCLTSGGAGAPVWGSCAGAAGSVFQSLNGAIVPYNSTQDLLVGGQSTASAKFAFLNANAARGSQTASISGNIVLDAAGSLQTTNAQTLTIGGGGTGNIVMTPNGTVQVNANAGSLLVGDGTNVSAYANFQSNRTMVGYDGSNAVIQGGTSKGIKFNVGSSSFGSGTAATIDSTGNFGIGTVSPTGKFVVSGTPTAGGNSLVIFNQTGSSDIFTASASGTPKFTLANNGNIAATGTLTGLTGLTSSGTITLSGLNVAGGVVYTDNSGVLASVAGTSGQCLVSAGSSAPSWANCSTGSSQVLQSLNGAIVPYNSTQDFLVGGQSTASAKFAFLNVNSGTPTASIAGSVSGRGLSLDGDGTIATTLNRSLALNPNGGRVGIGNSNPSSLFSVGSSSQFQVNSSGAIAAATGINSSGTITFSGISDGIIKATSGVLSGGNTVSLTSEVSGVLGITNGGTNGSATPILGAIAYGTGTAYGFSGVGSSGQCLVSGGAGSPTWANCSTGSSQVFQSLNGAIVPYNSTQDFLVGGQASTSAKFAFLNVNSGTPTASIAGSVAGRGISIDGDGTISTTLNRTLSLNPNGGNVGIGTSSPASTFAVNGNASIGAGYVGTAAPTNGLIVQGNLGIADSNPVSALSIGSSHNFQVNNIGIITQAAGITSSGTITFSGLNTAGGVVWTDSSGNLSSTSGLAGRCLTSGGSSAPTWVNCSAASGNLFQISAGAIIPANSTTDFLIGGQSSASAKFAVLNVNSGTPTASLSASGASGFYFTASGSAQTTGRQTLAFGGGTTGNISINNINNTPFATFDTTNNRFGLGTTAPSAKLDIQDLAVTSGNGIAGTFNGLTSGIGLAMSSTSNALTTGGLASFDWSPTTATVATGDLVSLNIGANGTIGNIFNVKNGGSSVFSVSQSQITASLPTAFTAPGDTTMAYDLQFSNPVSSYIKSAAPLYLQSGEIFNSSDLTLRTFNSGNVIVDSQALQVNQAATISGTLSLASLGTAGSIPYITNSSGTVGVSAAGLAGQCLLSGGAAVPTWGTCGTVSPFQASTGGIITPLNSTQDFLVGGQASTSAKFAVLNVNSGTPTASLSASGASGFYFTASGSAQTTGRQTLSLGGGTTGNIAINNTLNTPFGFFDTTNSRFGLGTTTPAAKLDVQDAAITTGNGIAGTFNGLTSGFGISLSSTSTALTTGGLASFDWSPTTTTTATGDLVSLNIGANGTIGNIFNIKNNGTSVFSVSQSQITASLPVQFNAPGDVGIAYDLQFTNPSSSTIKSTAPLYIQSGESYNSSDLTFKTFNSGNIILDAGAEVGIGTTAPAYKLDVQDSQSATYAAQIYNTDTGANSTGLGIKLGFTGTGATTNTFITFLNGLGKRGGRIASSAANGVTYNTGAADLAEWFTKNDSSANFATGTLMCQGAGGVEACKAGSGKSIVGIVSENPGFLGGVEGSDKVIVGLTGQVPVRITSENGTIKSGDLISFSSKTGVASKVAKAGPYVGVALNDYDNTDPNHEGTIMVLVHPSYTDPDSTLVKNDLKNYSLSELVDGSFLVRTPAGLVLDQVLTASDAIVGNLTVGKLTAKSIQTDSLQIGSLTLDQYIAQVVQNLNTGANLGSTGSATTPSASGSANIAFNTQTVLASSSSQIASGAAQVRVNLADLKTTENDIVITGEAVYLNQYFETAGNAFIGNNLGVNNNLVIGKGLVVNDTGIDFLDTIATADRKFNLLGVMQLDAAGQVSIKGDLTVHGRISTDDPDVAGFAKVKAGDSQVTINFSRPYAEVPVITATPDDSDTRFSIANKSVNGFTIKLKAPATADVTFNWTAVSIIGAKTFESPSATLSGGLASGSGQVAGTSTGSGNLFDQLGNLFN